MKPQMLKITGINSFNETQEIDFNKILNAGIFGIFGDTGSGKSTIIDAITLALYGKIVRYNGKYGNGDFLNLNRNNGKVEFTFSVKNGKDKTFYEIYRQFKRNNKGEIKSHIVRLSILKQDEKEIISDKKKDIENKIVDIIGLEYEDFTKAVVLPQGKFSDFLMLENIDKRKMLQRIFGLEKYGDKLKDKINEKKSNQESIVQNLKKEVEMYGDISIESIENEKISLIEEEKQLKQLEKDNNKILQQEEYFSNILNLKKEHLNYNKKLEELYLHKDTFYQFENSLNLILEAEKIAPHILERNNILKENQNILYTIENLNLDLKNIKEKYESIENQYIFYKNKKQEEEPKLNKIKQDLEICINFINEKDTLENEVKNINSNIESLLKTKEQYNKDILNIENKKEVLNQKIESILIFNQENKIDNQFKEDLKNGINLKEQENNIKLKIEELKDSINLYNIKIEENNIKFQKIQQEILKEENIIKKIVINNIKNIENSVLKNNNLIEIKNKENNIIQEKIEEINIQIKIQENKEVIQELSNKLIKGKPCPLCGSKEHPSPINIIFDNIVSTLKNEKYKNEQQIKNNINDINNLNMENTILYKNIENIKVVGKKYNICDYSSFDEEYIFDKESILEKIYTYENSINENKQILTTINISNENIINLKQEKNEELEKNIKLSKDINSQLDSYYKKLNTCDFYLEYNNILNLEETINKNNQMYLTITKELDNINNDYSNMINITTNLEKDEVSLNTKKLEKQSIINELNIKIEGLSYNKNPKEYIISIKNDINNILANEEKYKSLFEKILDEKSILEKNINEKMLKNKINEDTIRKKENYIKEYMQQSYFDDEEKILKSFEEKDKKEYYMSKVKSYTEKLNNYQYNIKRIEKEFLDIDDIQNFAENINSIDLEFLNEKTKNILKEKEKYNTQNKIIIQNITKLKISISQKEETLKKIENISNNIKKEEKILDLLKELAELNKGGVFVEYVANRQLKHIVLDASKRLFFMSQNKYSLELLENNFVIKDHYNGGVIRSPRSLSGGEIFMASLSLALSLSSKIQLKNKAPLEIFFLDEGFGTLDNNSLDTVINTLEQLQTNNISVGIITHIEEIKNRVQNKIIVTSSNNGAKVST